MAKSVYRLLVMYAAGAFIDSFFYAEGEIVEMEELPDGKVPKWAVLVDKDGNHISEQAELPGQSLAKGGTANQPPAVPVVPTQTSRGGPTDTEARAAQIREAAGMLDPKDDTHWIKDGKPQIPVIEKILGYDVTRKEIDEAAPQAIRPAQ